MVGTSTWVIRSLLMFGKFQFCVQSLLSSHDLRIRKCFLIMELHLIYL